ncbi:MAG: SHOCT domain-containing protein [Candidatus Zixiibacteriota bacterium]
MMWFGGGWMIIFWIALIVGAFFLVKYLVDQSRRGSGSKESTPLDVLKRRYASGEITKDEFEQKKKDLVGY